MKDFGIKKALSELGLQELNAGTSTGSNNFSTGKIMESYSPVDGKLIGKVKATTREDYEKVMAAATGAFKTFRNLPAPQRGEIVRQFGNKLRDLKEPLGKLVSYEMGKSLQEGYGEVQEMIDICDFAVGLSRQLNGQTIPSERPGHVMREQWHPIGVVGIISAFNFPVAVWAWNTALAWICGDVCVWKGSEKAPLCTVACQNIIAEIIKENNLPEGISCIINGDYTVGEMMTTDTRVPLVSATGSTRMGRIVGATVAQRFGKSLLELGGNNAIIITPTADLKVVVPGAVFGAVGTCGQRCTSTRRLIIHESVYDKVRDAIVGAYGQLTIGNPLDEKNHIGPLIDHDAVNTYLAAIEKAKAEAESKRLQGQGIADQRREIARGLEESVEVLNKVGINSQEASALIVVTQHYDTLQSIGEATNTNLILLPNSPQAGSDMLNNMVASFTASNQIGEAMKEQKALIANQKKKEDGDR